MSRFSDWRVAPMTPSRVDTPDGAISVSWKCNSDGGDVERKAEDAARLISAAPDLLGACKTFLQAMSTSGASNGAIRSAEDSARAAIAKATEPTNEQV